MSVDERRSEMPWSSESHLWTRSKVHRYENFYYCLVRSQCLFDWHWCIVTLNLYAVKHFWWLWISFVSEGTKAECPVSAPQPDGTECLEKGLCRNGTCLPFCETQGYQSCMCDTVADACKRCCRYHLNDTCFPFEPFDILPDGTPCVHGFCNSVSEYLFIAILGHYSKSFKILCIHY